MFRVLGKVCYGLSAASIALSLVLWLQRQNQPKGIARLFWRPNYEAAERVGIFVGLWAPTFAIAGKAMEDQDWQAQQDKLKKVLSTTEAQGTSGSVVDRFKAGLAGSRS